MMNRSFWLALGLACFSLWAQAANQLEALNVTRQNGEVLLRLDFSAPLAAAPTAFAIASPARLALDFAGVANALGRNAQEVNEGDLRSLNIVQVGERTRLVLNLARSGPYSLRQEGSALYVTLAPAGKAEESGSAKATKFSEARSDIVRHGIRDINFRRGRDGEGRIVVDLSDSGAAIDIRQQAGQLIVDFARTSVPENLRRKLDVSDFATPVQSVLTTSQGEATRLNITASGTWEHNAYQSENQFVIEVRKIVEDPNKLVQGSKIGYQGPRVSINYQSGDVRSLLRLMAEELGLNAVIAESVSGTVTLVLKEVPADQVIDIIFQQKGLDMRKNGNVILIAPKDEIANREKSDFEARQRLEDIEPLMTENIQINYQKAADIQRLLLGQTPGVATAAAAATGTGAAAPAAGQQHGTENPQRILSRRGSVVADPRTNLIFVRDTVSKLEEIRKYIAAIDVPVRQVMIEARIVLAEDNFSKDLGARLGISKATNKAQGGGVDVGGNANSVIQAYNNGVAGSNSPGLYPNLAGQNGVKKLDDPTSFSPNVNLPISQNPQGLISFLLYNAARTRFLNVELSALEADGRGKIVSNPRVLTSDNVKAIIKQGTKIPYQTVSNSGTQTQFQDAVLSLEVTPQITPDGHVLMTLQVKKDQASSKVSTTAGVAIDTREVSTQALVENGGTIVIGGVYEIETRGNTEKVPFFGDIPYLGFFFRHKQEINNKTELLVFITPRILSSALTLQ